MPISLQCRMQNYDTGANKIWNVRISIQIFVMMTRRSGLSRNVKQQTKRGQSSPGDVVLLMRTDRTDTSETLERTTPLSLTLHLLLRFQDFVYRSESLRSEKSSSLAPETMATGTKGSFLVPGRSTTRSGSDCFTTSAIFTITHLETSVSASRKNTTGI